jgi:NAD(P)H-hydrate epimerase
MSDLPENLYTATETRALDRAAIDDHGVPGYVLMSRAGQACFDALRERWPEIDRVTVFCGGGNNGGDGYVIARLALEAGLSVATLAVSDPESLKGDAAQAFTDFTAAGGQFTTHLDSAAADGLLVDALLGTGLDREVGGAYAELVDQINRSGLPVVSVDIPSGLCADSGAVLGVAVVADLTISFIGLKRGLLTGEATEHVGELLFDDLSVPTEIYAQVPGNCRLLDQRLIGRHLGPRARNAHKGSHGSVLLVGGDEGMPGAVLMGGEAALRSGAGLVKVATRASHAGHLPMSCPELMGLPVEDAAALQSQLEWAGVVALGPGLGQSAWSKEMFMATLSTDRPMIIDADGLNLLAESQANNQGWILTPHPGEAARLLGCNIAEIQKDRFAAAAAIAQQYGGVCVLKGAGTVIASRSGLRVCRLGNPGMATAGMGDVLTGVAAAMLAQGLGLDEAADVAVCVHARAGDLAAAAGERGLMARDVIASLQTAVNPCN